MDRTDESSQKTSLTVVILWVLAALLLYVLSLGPAVRLHQNSSATTRQVIETIYAPLELLRHLPLRVPLEMYLDLWRK
ncbi:MAG: hypothetical protein JWN70_5931 [Planctomycetaceae bacterium]|nr:hypothetical protein [Planctomycetaceae bacterium]